MDSSLSAFVDRRVVRSGWAWHEELDDDIFNQIWDAFQSDRCIGARTVMVWLESLGYENVTEGRVKTIRFAKRR